MAGRARNLCIVRIVEKLLVTLFLFGCIVNSPSYSLCRLSSKAYQGRLDSAEAGYSAETNLYDGIDSSKPCLASDFSNRGKRFRDDFVYDLVQNGIVAQAFPEPRDFSTIWQVICSPLVYTSGCGTPLSYRSFCDPCRQRNRPLT